MTFSTRMIVGVLGLILCPTLTFAGPTLNLDALGKSLGGWDDKNQTAAKYKSADSNYRTYKPTKPAGISDTAEGGLFISTKIDHIRGNAADDHCQLEMTFNAQGKLTILKAEITIGDNKLDTSILTAASDDARVKMAAKLYDKLTNQVTKWSEFGGRKNFPAVIQHNINYIIMAVTPQPIASPTLNMAKLGKDLGGWSHKNNTAAEYKSADSNYRTYKPTVSKTANGGLYVSTKINHIRGGGADDYCILVLSFDSKRRITNAESSVIMGNHKFDMGIILDLTDNERVKAAAEVYYKLSDQIAKWGEKGGRKNFPAVIRHNINTIAAAVQP